MSSDAYSSIRANATLANDADVSGAACLSRANEYVIQSREYAAAAEVSRQHALNSLNTASEAYYLYANQDISAVSAYVVTAGIADLSVSNYKSLAYAADSSANAYASLVSGQVSRMVTDISYARLSANDASSNAASAVAASTSSEAWGFYTDASNSYVSANTYYIDTSNAHSSAYTYYTDASFSAAEAGRAYSGALVSFSDVSNAYNSANSIYNTDISTNIALTLKGKVDIIYNKKISAALDVSYTLGYYLDASFQAATAYAAYASTATYVATAFSYANDASGSTVTAYNAYTQLLFSEQAAATAAAAAATAAEAAAAAAAAADYYTPAPFTSILAQPYNPTIGLASLTLTTRTRYMIRCTGGGTGANAYDGYLSIDSSFNLVLSPLSMVTDTYKDVMCRILEVVDISSVTNTINVYIYTYFRIDSDLDNLYSLDCSGTSEVLKFSNNWGKDANTTCGYVNFGYSSTSNRLVAGTRQYISDSSYNHSLDTSFNPPVATYVMYTKSTGLFTLTTATNNRPLFYFIPSPIDCDMPTDFNPYQIPYVPNTRVSISSYVVGSKVKNTLRKMDSSIKTSNMKPAYLGQIDVSGSNWRTDLCGNAMLDSIYANVRSQGNSLRYDLSVYKSFRSGALNTTLGCNSIADGTLGQNTVPYVYYTLESDSSGKSHPFMVIASYSISDKPNRLLDVCRPPADGTNTYATDPVTRDVTLQNYLMKIPMLDYGRVATLTENTMRSSLLSEYRPGAGDPAFTTPSPYNYASTSAIGIAVDGVVIYPVVNNTLHPAQSQAEITNTGIHIGQGMGLHYHADGQGATSNNMNLYNSKDYVDRRHPPLIGFGLDGIALYGQYDVSYSNMHGNTNSLDEYGGHDHGTSPNAYGYHYHAHTVNSEDLSGVVNNSSGVTGTLANPLSYNARVLMKGAWAGKINTIPEFWDIPHNTPSFTIGTNNSYYVGISGGNSSPPPPPL